MKIMLFLLFEYNNKIFKYQINNNYIGINSIINEIINSIYYFNKMILN